MIEGRDHLLRERLGECKHVFYGTDRTAGYAFAEDCLPLQGGTLCKCCAQFGDDLGGAGGTHFHCGVVGVGG